MSIADRSLSVLNFGLDLFRNGHCRWLPGLVMLFLGLSGVGALHAQTAHFRYSQSTIASGRSGPSGVAVDGDGNVYIADTQNYRVLKETPTGGGYTESTIVDSLNLPFGVAVDGGGNVYIADNNRVLKETLLGGSYTQSVIVGGLSGPQGVAVDSNGNVYIADGLIIVF